MGKAGWVSIRNIPKLKKNLGKSVGLQVFDYLQEFFKTRRVCPKCRGRGFILKKETQIIPTAMVKYKGISELEKLKEEGLVNVSDIIREIISIKSEGRKACPKCKGKIFLKKSK